MKYSKEQILKSKKFVRQYDVLSVILNDDQEYTIEEIQILYDEFMKKGVK